MKKVQILVAIAFASSMMSGCDTRRRWDVKDSSLPFANSLIEAISTCKNEAQARLREDQEILSEYGFASYHTDEEAARQVLSIPCDTNYVSENWVSRARGLDLGEICSVSDNSTMRVKKLIPDEDSVNNKNWDEPYVTDLITLSVVQYPCKNGNGCEKILVTDPDVRWIVRDPSKCNLPADSLEPN